MDDSVKDVANQIVGLLKVQPPQNINKRGQFLAIGNSGTLTIGELHYPYMFTTYQDARRDRVRLVDETNKYHQLRLLRLRQNIAKIHTQKHIQQSLLNFIYSFFST